MLVVSFLPFSSKLTLFVCSVKMYKGPFSVFPLWTDTKLTCQSELRRGLKGGKDFVSWFWCLHPRLLKGSQLLGAFPQHRWPPQPSAPAAEVVYSAWHQRCTVVNITSSQYLPSTPGVDL